MTMRYDSISRVGHFNHTILREIRKVCTTKAGLGITIHFHIYTIW